MKIIVCIKQVPNTTEIKIDPVTNTLKRDGVPSIINPDDKTAIEAALTLKEKTGATVTVITMGPAQAEKALREALAMGADEAFLLTDRAFAGSDTLATSTIIAAAIRKLGADVVINRKTEAVDEVLQHHPVDVALDCAGGALLGKCLNAVNPGGRWILVSTLGGETTELPLRVLLKKHIRLMGSTLRSRSDAEKSDILKQLSEVVWPEVSSGKIRPVIHAVFPLEEAAGAHKVLAEQKNTGKVVLTLK